MDSDADGVPSEFFDYFKVLIKNLSFFLFFFLDFLKALNKLTIFLGLNFTYALCPSKNSGFMHSRLSYMS